MADDKTKTGKPDRDRVNVHEPYEVTGWCNHWGCTKEELVSAVNAVGVMANNVEAHLRAKRHLRK